jgi:hypothetical protein
VRQFEVPRPAGGGEILVDVLAVGLHPRTRTGAAGAHYTSTGALPMIPGIDGVARRPDGKRIYFVAADDVIGTMADKAVADVRRSIELPDGAPSPEGAAEGLVIVPARVRNPVGDQFSRSPAGTRIAFQSSNLTITWFRNNHDSGHFCPVRVEDRAKVCLSLPMAS